MIQNPIYRVPHGTLTYNPHVFSHFSVRGEEIVNDLVKSTPSFHHRFNSLISLSEQKDLLYSCFFEGKVRHLKKGKRSPNKSFFEKDIKFHSIVPSFYKRTEAPRLTTAGGTLHGMHKEMSTDLLKECVKVIGGTVIDIDFSACHANVASAVQNKRHTDLYKLVHLPGNFWSDSALIYKEQLKRKNVNIDIQQLRSILKVSFYTSLNGGNPFNKTNLLNNLKGNAPSILNSFVSEEVSGSVVFKTIQEELSQFKVISEVKSINEKCTHPLRKQTFTIDRKKPYNVSSVHKGISRVLQSFEIVLLSNLTRILTDMGGIPLNLAHDGLLVWFDDIVDPQKVCASAKEQISPWSRYLLQGTEIGVEPKTCIQVNL